MKTRILKAAMAAAVVAGLVLLASTPAQAGHGTPKVRTVYTSAAYAATVQPAPCYVQPTRYVVPAVRTYPTRTMGFNHAYHRTYPRPQPRVVVQPSRSVVVVIVVR